MAGMALRRLPTTRLAAIEAPAVSVEELQVELRRLQQRKAATAAVAQSAGGAAAAAGTGAAAEGAGAAAAGDQGEGEGAGQGLRTAEELRVSARVRCHGVGVVGGVWGTRVLFNGPANGGHGGSGIGLEGARLADVAQLARRGL